MRDLRGGWAERRVCARSRHSGVATVTHHFVGPFGRGADGDPVLLELIESPNPGSARRWAQAAAAKHADAISISRTGDPNTGDLGVVVVLGTYAEVDRGGRWEIEDGADQALSLPM